jgi:putative salt-induced outer membrane protein
MAKIWFVALILLLLVSNAALADQVVLKNGDRLTGVIVKSDEKALTLKSDLAGTVTLSMDAIVQISSDQSLNVVTKDGKTVVGSVTADTSTLQVRSSDSQTVSVLKESVVALRSKDEQSAWERMQHPGLGQLWSGALDTGLGLTQGNAKTTSFNMALAASRATTTDKVSLYAISLYARNSTTGTSLVTANAKRGGGRYDYNITSRSFGFGFGDLESDDFQKLDLRVNVGGGLGWHAIKAERLTFDLFGGGSMNQEYFSNASNRRSADLVAGNELTFKVSDRSMFKERTVLFPNMSQTGEYRVALDTSLATAVSKWLSWQLSLSNRYLSNPVVGIKGNDFILSTGLRLTFAR